MKKWFVILLSCIALSAAAQLKYRNPILGGFYPDPSICRAGEDYYIVNSTFAYFPGLPIFHSRDLVNWKQIGHALDRPGQLKLDGAGVSAGLYAPAITYHKGKFYIVCTNVSGIGNFVVTADHPAGPWSDPVALAGMPGIDPSIFFDDNDSAYIVWNSDPPGNKALYDGHRAIRMLRFDAKKLATFGEVNILVDGGTDISKKPRWIEGPHLFKKDGWYYLMAAEGGTEINHSEVIFRSKNIDGPFIPYAGNPILTQRHLDPNRPDQITSTGHADLVETPDGRWFAVFLGCRPYEGNHYNTGRETFMAPVQWKDGWPHITQGNELVQQQYPVPFPGTTRSVVNPYSNPSSFTDKFNKSMLDHRYLFLRTPREQWYSLTEKPGELRISLRPQSLNGKEQPSFIGFRQQSGYCEAATTLNFTPASADEKAGLVLFQNETHYYFLCIASDAGKPVIQLLQSSSDSTIRLEQIALPAAKGPVQLNATVMGSAISFSFQSGSRKTRLITVADARFLSTETAGGFVGTIIGMHARSNSSKTVSKAHFLQISYRDISQQ